MLRAAIAALLCLGFIGCASSELVPSGAGTSLNYIEGQMWNWRRTVNHGCVRWEATRTWAVVTLSADSGRCEEEAPGVRYQTGVDDLVFVNYGAEPQPDFSAGVPYGGPCSYAVSQEQIERLRAVAREALARATTDGERRTFARVDQLLTMTNGEALESVQLGCGASAIREAHNSGRLALVDTWTNTSNAVAACDTAQPLAVTTVPSPFDQHMKLVCTESGQTLMPIDDHDQWTFQTGTRGIPSTGYPVARTDQFSSLAADELTGAELADFRVRLENSETFQRMNDAASGVPVAERSIVGLVMRTRRWRTPSYVYLFVPPGSSPQARVIGITCQTRLCDPLYENSVFFAVLPKES